MRCRHKFSKRKKKNKRMKRTKKKQRSMFSMYLDFTKFLHFQTRSKSLSRALLQFEYTNAQHTGIWWLPRPTFCQAAPFVINRIDDAIVHTHWSDHVIVWKSQCIQTAKARTCISHTLTFIRNNPTVMTLLFTHSECSFETLHAYKVPTSCSLIHT